MSLFKKNKKLSKISPQKNSLTKEKGIKDLIYYNSYRKINIFYADDLSENVRNLLEGIQQAGLISKTKKKRISLILNLPDKKEHYQSNMRILKSENCLINLDYSTKIEDSIAKIKNYNEGFDLIISDLYFGDHDHDFRLSKIGGIWIMFWAMHLAKERKAVCKLYSGQLATVVEHIDFQKAKEFLEKAYFITIEEIEKSKDARSWREYLQQYLEQVRNNIMSEIEMNDRIDFINYLASHLRREHFNNLLVDGKLNEFKRRLLDLEKKEFCLVNRQKMKVIHLFPIILGSHYTTNDHHNFQNMSADMLERILYKNELTFSSREKRNIESKKLIYEGIKFEEFRKHDETSRPVYGIRFLDKSYDIGLISHIENSFINSLDFPYQIHNFFTNQRGFGFWSNSTPSSKIGKTEFDKMRKNFIIPSFEKIHTCFNNRVPIDKEDGEKLSDQIIKSFQNIKENYFWIKKINEQTVEHKFLKFETRSFYDETTKSTVVPLQYLFRLNVVDFLKIVLGFKEGKNYSQYEDEEFVRITRNKFYWYGNAYVVRMGLKDLKNNMYSNKPFFYLLESRAKEGKALIKYKIILKDLDNGLPSIARQFQPEEEKVYRFDEFLKGFCQIIIRSKMKDFNGICYHVFTSKKDISDTHIKDVGTEFEIQFTQGREH